jgi:NAD(P)H-hydrate repair Nnr-like enzyme with NAD(P)H-hydrate dehydratase domain
MLMATGPNYRGDMDTRAGRSFGPEDAAAWIAVPGPDDDKYSRGVVGFVTGSARYPGAAVLGVEAALHTGVGMVRYLGAGRPTRLVLQRRPEAVTVEGRVQAWVVGSGQDPETIDDVAAAARDRALGDPGPIVIDAGALGFVEQARGARVLVPHAGELARLLHREREAIAADPAASALEAAERFGAVSQAEVVAIEGGRHLWVGETFVRRAMNEIVARLAPGRLPLPTTWDGPYEMSSDYRPRHG